MKAGDEEGQGEDRETQPTQLISLPLSLAFQVHEWLCSSIDPIAGRETSTHSKHKGQSRQATLGGCAESLSEGRMTRAIVPQRDPAAEGSDGRGGFTSRTSTFRSGRSSGRGIQSPEVPTGERAISRSLSCTVSRPSIASRWRASVWRPGSIGGRWKERIRRMRAVGPAGQAIGRITRWPSPPASRRPRASPPGAGSDAQSSPPQHDNAHKDSREPAFKEEIPAALGMVNPLRNQYSRFLLGAFRILSETVAMLPGSLGLCSRNQGPEMSRMSLLVRTRSHHERSRTYPLDMPGSDRGSSRQPSYSHNFPRGILSRGG